MLARPQVLAFDVIETLFSLEPLRPFFTDAGLPDGALETWFAGALRDMFALAAAESYAPMKEVLSGSLAEVCARRERCVDKDALLQAMAQLPPHPDVPPGLQALKEAGFRMIAVTNGARSTTEKLLTGAGLRSLFDKLISTDDIKRAKPHAKVYLHAAREAQVEPEELMLIASHPWDIHGAKRSALKAAYLKRGKPFPKFLSAPDMIAESLPNLGQQLAGLLADEMIS